MTSLAGASKRTDSTHTRSANSGYFSSTIALEFVVRPVVVEPRVFVANLVHHALRTESLSQIRLLEALTRSSVSLPGVSTPSRPVLVMNVGIVLPDFGAGAPREAVERAQDLDVVARRKRLGVCVADQRDDQRDHRGAEE